MSSLGENADVLLSNTVVSFAADADTVLFTVPAGKRCVLTKASVIAGASAGATTALSIGAEGAETDFVNAIVLSNLDAQYDACIVGVDQSANPNTKLKSYAAGTVIDARIATQSGGATNNILLFGILY